MMFRRRPTTPPITLGCAISRNDFLDSLRLLGARMGVPRPCTTGSIVGEVQDVSLNCSRDVWERVIGPPRNVVCHYSPTRRGLYHSWEHHWVGGSVKCFGCLVERTSDSHWLFLSRALFVDQSPATTPRCPPAEIQFADALRQPA